MWKACSYAVVGRLIHLAVWPGGAQTYNIHFRPYYEPSYTQESIMRDSLLPYDGRAWQEVTFQGFCLVMTDTLGIFSESPELVPFFVDPFTPFERGSPPRTNHKIGVPKGKLP